MRVIILDIQLSLMMKVREREGKGREREEGREGSFLCIVWSMHVQYMYVKAGMWRDFEELFLKIIFLSQILFDRRYGIN